MIVEALKYPVDEEGYERDLLIGTLLTIGSIFILPIFILFGYFVRTVQNSSNDEPLPKFEDYTGLFIDGIKITGVALGYFGLIFALMFLVVFAGEISNSLGLAAMWLALVPAFFFMYYGQVSIIYYFSKERSFKDAFNFKAIAKTALTVRYLKVILLLFVIQILFAILQIMLIITVVGLILIPTSFFYEGLVYSKLVSEIE